MVAFALAIYGLVIFSRILEYIEMAVVDTFEKIQHRNNLALAILVETFRSLNYCCRNQEGFHGMRTTAIYLDQKPYPL